MPKVSAAFFATGALCILFGGALGLFMSYGGDAAYAGMHVHLNLVGWATMGLCGTFYALAREHVSMRLAWINYAVLTAGILLFFPAYAVFLRWGLRGCLPVAQVGNGLTGLGMVIFAFAAVRELLRRRD
ncbi:MAG: hypothetical protein ACXU8U_00330 [Asticcacaulis sp.]